MPRNARLLSIRNADGMERLGAVTDKGLVKNATRALVATVLANRLMARKYLAA